MSISILTFAFAGTKQKEQKGAKAKQLPTGFLGIRQTFWPH